MVIASGDRLTNTSEPFEGPGWQNVSGRGEGSTVYLGNRWMITAAHVGAGPVVLDNRDFTVEPNTTRQLTNPIGFGLSQSADLLMFRLNEDPGIPGINISATPPLIGERVTMIGRGAFRDDTPIGFELTPVGSGFRWTQVPLAKANVIGFVVTTDRGMRWGTGNIAFDFENDNDNNIVVTGASGDVLAMATTFGRGISGDTAQAVEGDSGGGVFKYTPEGWELAGIMTSTKLFPNQPMSPVQTVVFGNQTYFADLTRYRNQILSILVAPPSWQNQIDQFDVNNDGVTAATDVLALVNELNDHGRTACHSFRLPRIRTIKRRHFST